MVQRLISYLLGESEIAVSNHALAFNSRSSFKEIKQGSHKDLKMKFRDFSMTFHDNFFKNSMTL